MKARNPSTGNLETVYVKALDSMPVGSIVDFTGSSADVPAGWEEVYDYSTTEIDTGKKWIDGKHIYRKVINVGALSDANQKTIAHGISNFNRAISLEGYFYRSSDGMCRAFNFLAGSSSMYLQADATNLYVVPSWNPGASECYVIMEYTKTTD